MNEIVQTTNNQTDAGVGGQVEGAVSTAQDTTPAVAAPVDNSFDFDRELTDDEKVNLGDLFAQPKPAANTGVASPADGGTQAQDGGMTETTPAPKEPVVEKPSEMEQIQNAINMMAQTQQAIVQNQNVQTQQQPAEPNFAQLYDFKIPVETLAKVYSENVEERAAGLTQIMQGSAVAVHRNMINVMTRYAQDEIPRIIQNQFAYNQAQQTVRDDFYGTYPELNRPELKPLVLQVAQQVMEETKTNSWSGKFRDTIAKRVKDVILAVGGQKQQTATLPPKANFISPAAGQYGAPSSVSQEEAEIAELIQYTRNKGF